MRSKLLISAAIMASMSAAPVLANPAASLSLKGAPQVRASTPTAKTNRLTSGGWVAAGLAVAIVAGGIIIVADDDSDSN